MTTRQRDHKRDHALVITATQAGGAKYVRSIGRDGSIIATHRAAKARTFTSQQAAEQFDALPVAVRELLTVVVLV